MQEYFTRRTMLRAAGVTAASGLLEQGAMAGEANADSTQKLLVVGVSCSPRKGMTTATAVKESLDAASAANSRIETALLDLGELTIGGSDGSSSSGGTGVEDDFESLLPVLRAPNLFGLIIGSPTYFRTMSSLCKAFLERLAILREPTLLLANVPVGVLSVGAYRNGGQELVIEQIQAAMLCHEVMIVGGKPRAHQGATLWNGFEDDIMKDELGIESARKLGVRVAEAAARIAR
ncbi:MAG: flavodoxin family protein [Candidatus Hydrogenedentes bacterium]|nr:flavodoxin family protein [Candidatus Hydrogenedentota bacterium]